VNKLIVNIPFMNFLFKKDMQAADQRATERSDAKNALEEYCFRMQHTFEDTKAVNLFKIFV